MLISNGQPTSSSTPLQMGWQKRAQHLRFFPSLHEEDENYSQM
jgi:hypothetical protein